MPPDQSSYGTSLSFAVRRTCAGVRRAPSLGIRLGGMMVARRRRWMANASRAFAKTASLGEYCGGTSSSRNAGYFQVRDIRSIQDSTVASFSSAATSSVREAPGSASNQAAPSASSSATSVPGRQASLAVPICCLRQMHGLRSSLRLGRKLRTLNGGERKQDELTRESPLASRL